MTHDEARVFRKDYGWPVDLALLSTDVPHGRSVESEHPATYQRCDTPQQAAMGAEVRADVGTDHQVVERVVCGITIDVMDNLGAREQPTNGGFHDKPASVYCGGKSGV